jgi:hypothetical protein
MRIVLASVHLEEGPEAVPLGAACVVSALKAAFPKRPGGTSGGGAECILVESFVKEGPETLVKKLKSAAAVGFSLYSWNRKLIMAAAEIIRLRHPEIFLFCGGPEAAARPGGLSCNEGGPFDAVIRGAGERETPRLLGKVLGLRAAEIPDPLPSPWLDGTLKAGNDRGVLWELGRGCPYSCFYCFESGEAGGKKQIRYIPEDRLRRELEFFIRRGTPYVFVLDPTFNSDNSRALKILDLIAGETTKAGSPPIHWHFEVRGELLNREQARRFAALGASVQIGLQSADPEVCAKAGRNLDRKRFSSKIALLNEEGVVFGLDLIYGLPGDTPAGFRRSLDFALSLYPNNLDLFRLAVLPGTVLSGRASSLGLIHEMEPPYELLETPSFSSPELERAGRLSQSADIFYNQGRAVAWFNAALRPLKIKPSIFLEAFAAYLKNSRMSPEADSREIQKHQLVFLEKLYRQKKKEHIFPALKDLVRYHGAWGRALGEGKTETVNCTYDPPLIQNGTALDLEDFAASFKPLPRKLVVRPGGVF